ncbi:alpha/beta hydrolase [Pleurocapsales cyanobacterium LEGE 06147]|nr:alpha/beta hydrolase [Pleurocapsales cyanobacterium LEGE 06147]
MTANSSIQAISVPPSQGEKPTHLLVALHGWGANAQDLVPFARMFNLPQFGFMFPNAPFAHPQVPGGRAWYALDSNEYRGLTQSRQLLLEWLQSLEKNTGVPLHRTFMAGFSQGGAMTLDVGLSLPLAGLCSLSGYLHAQPQARGERFALSVRERFPPVLIVHGRQDPVVPLQAAQQAREKLNALGINVKYREFNMGHEIQPPVLTLIEKFIRDNQY